MVLSRPGQGAVSFEPESGGGQNGSRAGALMPTGLRRGTRNLIAVVVEHVLIVVLIIGRVVLLVEIPVVLVVGRVVGVVVGGVGRREEVGKVDAVEVRAEEAEDGEDIGLRVVVEEGEDDGCGGEGSVRLIGGARATRDAGCDVEGDGGLSGRWIPGDEGELAKGDAVGPEPVVGLLDEEPERLEAGPLRAGGVVELGCG